MTPQLPSLELIKSMHTFPGAFIFKIIGDARDGFVAEALTLSMDALGDDREFTHTFRASSASKHLAITLSIFIRDANEVHAVYKNLMKLSGLRALF
jgi:putative lipoic acid-binding regulatory protein